MMADVRAGWVVPVFLLCALACGCDGPPPAIQPRSSLVGHSREVSSIAFAPDSKSLASRGADAVKLWDLAGIQESASFPEDGSDMGSIAFSPDGSAVATTLANKGAIVRDVASRQVRATYSHPVRPPGLSSDSVSDAWGLTYAPDGKTLAGGGTNGGEGGYVTLWDTATGAGSDLDMPGGPVTSVAITSDGKTLAAKGLGDAIFLWDLVTRRERRTIHAGRSFGAPVCFSPDGKTLVSADDNRRVTLWDVATGREVASLKWHLKAILSAAFHPEGRLLVSGDSGGTILLWDLRTRAAIARFEGHQGKVWSLAFSPDGKTLASAGQDKVVRLWDLSPAADDRR